MPINVGAGGRVVLTNDRLDRRVGPVGTVVLYVLCLFMIAIGPAMALFGLTLDSQRWIPVGMGILLAAFLIPFSVGIGRAAARARRHTRRLRAAGLPATAEVLATRPTSLGEMEGVALDLRISGPGIATFEVTHACRENLDLAVGARLPAVVDPSDGLFAIGHHKGRR